MNPVTPLFLDTTILVDRIIAKNDPARIGPIESLLADFRFLLACRYSQLELKRVVIQNLALTLRYIMEEKSYFRAFHRASRLQQQRRVGTLVNVLAFIGFEIGTTIGISAGENLDLKLAIQAESYIRNAIRYIWRRFDKSVDHVVNHMNCTRATEGPEVFDDGSVDASIRKGLCRERKCNNANFLRANLPTIRTMCVELDRVMQEDKNTTEELAVIRRTLKKLESDLDGAYNYATCLAIGDLWIHLEALKSGAKKFCTRNYKESQVLCPIIGLAMLLPGSG